MKIKFPSVSAVAKGVADLNANVEGETDVRLQVYDDGEWTLRWGLSDYDQDHRGYWGASGVPGVNRKGRVSRINSRAIAKNLIDQAKDQAADDGYETNPRAENPGMPRWSNYLGVR